MNLALLSTGAIWTPLQGLLYRWSSGLGFLASKHEPAAVARAVSDHASANGRPATRNKTKLPTTDSKSARPLRVVRLLEVGQAPTHSGRMVISGRMADVCAELDRLTASAVMQH